MKATLIDFVTRTQKATGALIGALSVLATMTFIPQPYSYYIGVALAAVTWFTTYGLPYIAQTVESLPDEVNPDAVSATELIERLEQEASQPAEPVAEVVDSPAPTENTPETVYPVTQPMPIEDVLAALAD